MSFCKLEWNHLALLTLYVQICISVCCVVVSYSHLLSIHTLLGRYLFPVHMEKYFTIFIQLLELFWRVIYCCILESFFSNFEIANAVWNRFCHIVKYLMHFAIIIVNPWNPSPCLTILFTFYNKWQTLEWNFTKLWNKKFLLSATSSKTFIVSLK